jgi:hypothetical protein
MNPLTIPVRVILWIWGSAAGVCLAQNVLPNSNFDEGQDQPTGWSLVGASGRRLPNGYGNRSVLMVEGNGKSQTFWRTEPIPLKPDSLYRFSFLGRSERTDAQGAAMAGLGTINRDFLPTGFWARYSYVFSFPETKDSKDYVRLGEWHVSGSVYFTDPALLPVVATSRRIAPDAELGEGESVLAGSYQFKPNFKWTGANYHRPLVLNRATFNTDRWVFFSGSEIIYRLGLIGYPQSRAKVQALLNYHAAGSLKLDASRDRTNWVSIATCDGQHRAASKDLPADLFPADSIFVRLSCEGANANLQLNSFEYESRLTKSPPDSQGSTSFRDSAQSSPAN